MSKIKKVFMISRNYHIRIFCCNWLNHIHPIIGVSSIFFIQVHKRVLKNKNFRRGYQNFQTLAMEKNIPMVNQNFLGYKWIGFLRVFFYYGAFLLGGEIWVRSFKNTKKHLRKNPFHLYPKKFQLRPKIIFNPKS